MVRAISFLFVFLQAQSAWAHVGHLGEVAGHGHWIALGAAAGAIAIGAALAKLRGAQAEASPEEDPVEDGEETQEASA